MRREYIIISLAILITVLAIIAFCFTYFEIRKVDIQNVIEKVIKKDIFKEDVATSSPEIIDEEIIPSAFAEASADKEDTSLETPEKVKGIYITGYTFSRKSRMKEIIDMIERTELNAIVIDIKDPNGYYMFTPENEKLKKFPVSKVAFDNDEFRVVMKDLQDKNIYTIARVLTFQDDRVARLLPDVALKNTVGSNWTNWKGIEWLDITSEEAWEIPVLKAREAIALGFDEVQFDYIRFPSDGNISNIAYKNPPEDGKKFKTLEKFYKYLSKELEDTGVPISIDLFGLTYQTRSNPEYDLNIGQRLIDAIPYFDYISPMVYPSHYPTGFLGYKNPAANPYAIVNEAMIEGNKIFASSTNPKAKTRPYLQDFNLGAVYNASMVRAQINACDDNNTAGWILWDSRNTYTEAGLKSNDEL